MPRRLSGILMMAIALLIGAVLAYFIDPHHRALVGQNDFAGLYMGGKFAGTPNLYSPEAQYAEQRKLFPAEMKSVVFSRPPFYAWWLKPLSMLPFTAAYYFYQLVSLGAMFWFLRQAASRNKELWLLAPMFPPLLATILAGQDIGIVMAIAYLSVTAARRGLDFTAGLILSLCAIKLHFFALVPLAALTNRRYRIVCGGAVGGSMLLALSLAGNGWDVVARYFALLRNPVLHPSADIMPNLHGLTLAVGGGVAAEIAAGVLVAIVVAWLGWRADGYEESFAYAILGGILISTHSYMQDCVLLLLAFTLFTECGAPKVVLGMLTFLLTPIPHIALQQGPPASAAVPLLLLAVLGFAAFSRRARAVMRVRIRSAPVSSPAH